MLQRSRQGNLGIFICMEARLSYYMLLVLQQPPKQCNWGRDPIIQDIVHAHSEKVLFPCSPPKSPTII